MNSQGSMFATLLAGLAFMLITVWTGSWAIGLVVAVVLRLLVLPRFMGGGTVGPRQAPGFGPASVYRPPQELTDDWVEQAVKPALAEAGGEIIRREREFIILRGPEIDGEPRELIFGQMTQQTPEWAAIYQHQRIAVETPEQEKQALEKLQKEMDASIELADQREAQAHGAMGESQEGGPQQLPPFAQPRPTPSPRLHGPSATDLQKWVTNVEEVLEQRGNAEIASDRDMFLVIVLPGQMSGQHVVIVGEYAPGQSNDFGLPDMVIHEQMEAATEDELEVAIQELGTKAAEARNSYLH